VKSVWEHASIGMEDTSVAGSAAALAAELERRSRREPCENLFVEGYVEGREFNIALLTAGPGREPQCLPPAEIQFVGFPQGKPRVVGYKAKWEEASFEYGATPRRFDFPESDAPLVQELVRLGRECWRLFGLRGYARVDFRVDAEGHPWILEVNTNPCLAPDAGFIAAATRGGITMEEVVRRVLVDAVPAHHHKEHHA
jgi:D-alanine-D-alanine ligase